jgi:hypothetical protein
MKFVTPDKTDLMVIERVSPHPDGIEVEGTIMGAMPMKAVLTPVELRRGFRFLRPRIIIAVIRMLLTGRA